MQVARWKAVAFVVPAVAALGVACERTAPTEAVRAGDARAAAVVTNGDGNRSESRFRADPFVFVGTAEQCGGVAGSNIVTAAWLGGMGLPDDGGLNGVPGNDDKQLGLLLNKNGPTPNCAASGARIRGVRGMTVGPTFALGFDYRDGGHCGAGAPRFNVGAVDPATGTETGHFGGCANTVSLPSDQDPDDWSTVRLTALQFFPPIPPGSRIESISILYDEGTDTPSANTLSLEPSGVGLAVIDNIFINGEYIRWGTGIAEPHGNRGRDRD